MKMTSTLMWVSLATVAMTFGGPTSAVADEAAPGSVAAAAAGGTLEEIVVTAQKRQQTANTVPMSITALSGDDLKVHGINSPADLTKIVPGLYYTQSSFSTPIYSLRGIGFNESSIGAKPSVSVYVDEVPLAFPIETGGAVLDLQRVEVLKGPQGTLFGQNSTGGAINYIAAKPTDHFEAGVSDEYGRFNNSVVEGFVSGPLAEGLKGRVALKTEQGDAWQRSYTTGAALGKRDKTSFRGLLDWTPIEKLKAELSFSGYLDKSDEQAAQFIAATPLTLPNIHAPALEAYPIAPPDDRAADWGPNSAYSHDNRLYQVALRVDYQLPMDMTLTSLSSYANYKLDRLQDSDGTTYQNFQYLTIGKIDTVSQELRLAGSWANRTHWIVGANYERDTADQRDAGAINYNNNAYALGAPPFLTYFNSSDEGFSSTAGFANLDVDVTDAVTLHAAGRYTKADISFAGCTGDTGDGELAAAWNRVFGSSVAPGQCVTLSPLFAPEEVQNHLDQNNTSWRAGADWKPANALLVYANLSKGFKSGSFPILSASASTQLTPVTQESVLAYEAGFKATLLDRSLQLNGALFYYDYKDKQFRGRLVDPVFGALEALVNIPKSRVEGAEAQLVWVPVPGLTANLGATYVDSKVQGDFRNFDPFGKVLDLSGESFPLTPKLQGYLDVQYEWPVSPTLNAFVGGNVSHQSSTYGGFGQSPLLQIGAYTLLDLRAGVATRDDKWRFSVWGRNVTNEYYWTVADHISDTTVRFTGMPATFGVSAAYRYH